MDDRVKDQVRTAWRELGFFYERDDVRKEWVLVGSSTGLLRFRDALVKYAADSRNDQPSEHEHYGPYFYLEVMTWPEAGMSRHAIHGPVADLRRLASLVEAKVTGVPPGTKTRISDEFATGSEYSLVMVVREDGFDPASADSDIAAGAG